MNTKDTTIVHLKAEEALLFSKFQQHHELIAYLVGYLESSPYKDLRSSQVLLDTDHTGMVVHMAVTKHFRK
jgi:hypothetical protein